MADETIIEKIQKLLALSTSSNENEAASALAKAQKLLLLHNISMEEVEALKKPDRVYVKDSVLISRGRWRVRLLSAIAQYNFCRMVYFPNRSNTLAVLVGEKINIEAVKLMYDLIAEQLVHMAAVAYMNSTERIHAATWKDSFYNGAIRTIRIRLDMERRGLDSHTMALVVVREDELNQAERNFFPKTRQAKPKPVKFNSGYEAGRQAGNMVRFRKEIE
jgi:hypothetical protein